MSVGLFIGNLPADASSQSLSTFLWDLVLPESTRLILDRDTGRAKGFGWATVGTPEDAVIACRADGSELDGRRLTVSVARPPAERLRGRNALVVPRSAQNPLQGVLDDAAAAPQESISIAQLENELLQALDSETSRDIWVSESLSRLSRDAHSEGEPIRRQMTRLVELLADSPQRLAELNPRMFEHLIAALLSASGYREVRLTLPSSDGGVDIYATKNNGFGKSIYLIQCKRYAPDRKVSRPDVQLLYGVLTSSAATRAALATTSCFTKPAREFIQQVSHRMAGIDGQDLKHWLLATNQVLQANRES